MPYSASNDALNVWSQGHTEPSPSAPTFCWQKAWDNQQENPRVRATYENLLDSAPDTYSRSRLFAAAKKESGAWLHAFPMSALGLRMDDEVIQVAMGLRLGATLCQPHKCHHCGAHVDHLVTHGLSCRKSQGRHSCHAAINDLIKRSLAAVKVPAHLVFHDQMVNGQMDPLLSHGKVDKF